MRKLTVDNVKPGVIVAKDVCNNEGNKIIKSGTKLDAQMILRLKYYNIDHIYITGLDSGEALDESELLSDIEPSTLIYKIKSSDEFKHFKKVYYGNLKETEAIFHDMVVRNQPIDKEKLMDICHNLFAEHPTGIGLMNMLLCIREIDDTVYAHSINVALTSRVLGTWLGFNETEVDRLTICGLLHDIGKSFVPSQILNNPNPLTPHEVDIIRQHCEYGYNLLTNQPNLDPIVAAVAYQHHERCDGSGYPLGLLKEDIHPFSLVVAIADMFDAMTSARIYRAGICPFEVIAEFELMGYNKLDPGFTKIFLDHIVDSFIDTQVRLNDGREGIILRINPQALTRPLIKLLNGEYLDLNTHWDLRIEAVV